MPSVLRATLAVVGLAAIVHGVASLTGGWLGTPPWWEREEFSPIMKPIDFDRLLAKMDALLGAGA